MVVKAIKGGFRIRNVGFHCAGITVSWCKNIHLKQQFHYINQSLPIQVKFSIFTGIFTINIWIISAYYSISIFWLLVPQKATQCHKQILYIICHKILFIYHLIPWLDKIDIIHISLNIQFYYLVLLTLQDNQKRHPLTRNNYGSGMSFFRYLAVR